MSNPSSNPFAAVVRDVERGPTVILTAARRLGLMVLVVGAASLGLVGCGDDDTSGDGLAGDTAPVVFSEPNADSTEEEAAAAEDGEIDLTDVGDSPTLEIRAADGSFEPSTVRVSAGSTVTIDFENEGTTTHTFTIEELDVDEEVEPGDTITFDVSFPDTGTVEFVCRIHEDDGMRGEFVVEEADVDASTTTTALTDGSGDPGSGSTPEGGTVPLDPGGLDGEGAGTDADNEDSSAGGVGSNN